MWSESEFLLGSGLGLYWYCWIMHLKRYFNACAESNVHCYGQKRTQSSFSIPSTLRKTYWSLLTELISVHYYRDKIVLQVLVIEIGSVSAYSAAWIHSSNVTVTLWRCEFSQWSQLFICFFYIFIYLHFSTPIKVRPCPIEKTENKQNSMAE